MNTESTPESGAASPAAASVLPPAAPAVAGTAPEGGQAASRLGLGALALGMIAAVLMGWSLLVGPQFLRQLHRLPPGLRFAHHQHVRLRLQQQAEALADDRMIVRDQDRDASSVGAWSAVRRLGACTLRRSTL